MKYLPIDNQLFVSNRKNFTKKLAANGLAIFHSNDEMPYSGDATFPFRQNADLFYLSGIDQEETILVLFPDYPNSKLREILFIKKTNEHIATWEGHKYTKAEAEATSGIKTVFWIDQFETILSTLISYADYVYLNMNENDRANSKVVDRNLRFAKKLKEKYPTHSIKRSSPIMGELRAKKHPIEIELIKQSCAITKDAFLRVLKFVKPGVMEYEIEAEIMHEFLKKRGTGYAYYPIIASGKNSCVLHYIANNNECKNGEILLMDFGVDYANYAADLTRTIPINGKYTKRQKELYNAVLRVLKEMRSMMRPGASMEELRIETGKLVESECLSLGLIDKADIQNQDKGHPAWSKYFMHGLGHSLGIDVHDLADRYKKLEKNNVYTCEPGIYVREEGIGIRIENDILITKDDPIDLMNDIPLEVEEIEGLMGD